MYDYTLYSLANKQFLTLLLSQSPSYSRSGRRRQRKCASARLHSGVCWNPDRPHVIVFRLTIEQPMGWTSEMVAQTYNISRQKQDEYALISHTRATKVRLLLC